VVAALEAEMAQAGKARQFEACALHFWRGGAGPLCRIAASSGSRGGRSRRRHRSAALRDRLREEVARRSTTGGVEDEIRSLFTALGSDGGILPASRVPAGHRIQARSRWRSSRYGRLRWRLCDMFARDDGTHADMLPWMRCFPRCPVSVERS